ncbi:MAG: 2-C-methyl-D-erythritol 4-phosphate cytidylyltransferase [Chloroflexi bacterium]|nr:2-C-methyl-D-erythritol 4-phosphate cytidylyltransferase [Chloroflexota bacterium]
MQKDKETVAAVIVAAGAGKRMGGLDKAFCTLVKYPVLVYTLDVFEKSPLVDCIVVVVREQSVVKTQALSNQFGWKRIKSICAGGQQRAESVRAGLKYTDGHDWVIIHDGTRPFVTCEMIERGLSTARRTGASTAAVPVKDTIKIVSKELEVVQTPDRESMWLSQTPQVFRRDLLVHAYASSQRGFIDEASLIEEMGIAVRVYWGSYDNIKITTPEDLELAKLIACRRGSKLVTT